MCGAKGSSQLLFSMFSVYDLSNVHFESLWQIGGVPFFGSGLTCPPSM